MPLKSTENVSNPHRHKEAAFKTPAVRFLESASSLLLRSLTRHCSIKQQAVDVKDNRRSDGGTDLQESCCKETVQGVISNIN